MSKLTDAYTKLDPEGKHFLGQSTRGTKSIEEPISWSDEFNQPVRTIKICNCSLPKLIGVRDNVPHEDPNYCPLALEVDPFRAALFTKQNLCLSGPAGSGKSSFIEQMAAKLNRPFYVFDVNEDSRPETLFGQFLPVNGKELRWTDGPVTKAFKNEGAMFLLDEANFSTGSILACMHRVLAGGDLRLHENNGELVERKPGIMFTMACNALNDTNSATIYHDTKPMNRAFLDRFGIVIRTGYPKSKVELTIILKAIKRDFPQKYQHLISNGFRNVVTKMIEIATSIREDIDKGNMDISFSIRRTLGWANLYAYYEELTRATHYCILNLEEIENAKAMDAIIFSKFGEQYQRKFQD